MITTDKKGPSDVCWLALAFSVLQMNADRRDFELILLDGTSHENDASFAQACFCCVSLNFITGWKLQHLLVSGIL